MQNAAHTLYTCISYAASIRHTREYVYAGARKFSKAVIFLARPRAEKSRMPVYAHARTCARTHE
eukprot:1296937-Pleurochrysis_carterae.AAC.2